MLFVEGAEAFGSERPQLPMQDFIFLPCFVFVVKDAPCPHGEAQHETQGEQAVGQLQPAHFAAQRVRAVPVLCKELMHNAHGKLVLVKGYTGV